MSVPQSDAAMVELEVVCCRVQMRLRDRRRCWTRVTTARHMGDKLCEWSLAGRRNVHNEGCRIEPCAGAGADAAPSGLLRSFLRAARNASCHTEGGVPSAASTPTGSHFRTAVLGHSFGYCSPNRFNINRGRNCRKSLSSVRRIVAGKERH